MDTIGLYTIIYKVVHQAGSFSLSNRTKLISQLNSCFQKKRRDFAIPPVVFPNVGTLWLFCLSIVVRNYFKYIPNMLKFRENFEVSTKIYREYRKINHLSMVQKSNFILIYLFFYQAQQHLFLDYLLNGQLQLISDSYSKLVNVQRKC